MSNIRSTSANRFENPNLRTSDYLQQYQTRSDAPSSPRILAKLENLERYFRQV